MGAEIGPVWPLLLLLLNIARDAEGACDARVNNSTCHGALGGTIEIQLMKSGAKTNKDRCVWKKEADNVFLWRKNTLKINAFQNRSVFNNISGILNITNLIRDDTGSYTLELFDSDKLTHTSKHNLIIETPVTDVLLKQECLSKGEVRATCSSGGEDRPEFRWTLNGLSLNKYDNVITLKQNTEGTLCCSVQNHISKKSEEIIINICGYIFINCTVNGTQIHDWVYERNNTLCIEQTTAAPITVGKITSTSHSVTCAPAGCGHFWEYWPILVGVLVAFLICGGVAVICVLKNKRDEEDDQELTYADITILKQPGREPQPKSEGEVEYGQVKFSNQSPHASVAEDNACIYSNVCR